MKTYKSINEVKQALLNLETVRIGKWSARINDNDELEMWAPNGDGRAAPFYYFDKAAADFCKWAGIPDKMPKPVTYDKTPSDSGPIGEDTSGDSPWKDPKINQQAPMQGQSSDESIGMDTSGDSPWTDPAVDKRPDEKAKDNGVSDPDLGSDTTKNPTKWGQSDGMSQSNKDFYIPEEDSADDSEYEPKLNTEPHQIQNIGENPSALREFHANYIVDTFVEPKRGLSYQELVESCPSERILRDIANPEKWAANQALRELGILDEESEQMEDSKDARFEPDHSMFLVDYEEDPTKTARLYEDKSAEGAGCGGVGMGEGVALPPGGSITYPKKKKQRQRSEAVAPPGKEDMIQKLKNNPEVDNPWALAWSQYNKEKGKKNSISTLAYALVKANTDIKTACKVLANPKSIEKFSKMDKDAQLDPSSLFEDDMLSDGSNPLNPEEFKEEDTRIVELEDKYDLLYNKFMEASPFMGSKEQVDGLTAVFDGINYSISGGDFDTARSMLDQVEQYLNDMPQPGLSSVSTKIKENWGENGQYQRDIEAESAEEMYHLVRSLGTEDSYDWSSYGKPTEPGEDMVMNAQDLGESPDMSMGVQAADDSAKTYWSDYFKDYGDKMTREDVSNKNRKDNWKPKVKETPKPENKGSDLKEAQMMNAPSPQLSPSESTPMPEAAPTNPTDPVAPQESPPNQQAKPAGPDQDLKNLGWTDEDLANMSPEDKQKIVQIKLKKPGSGVKETGPAPMDKTPKPAPPAGPPTEDGAKPGPDAPQPGPAPVPADPKAPIASKNAQQAQPAMQEPAPSQPVQDEGQANTQFVDPNSDNEYSPESEALKIYNQVMEQEVKATTADQVPALKSQILVQRLLTEVGMPINEARSLFGLTRDKGFNSLFK